MMKKLIQMVLAALLGLVFTLNASYEKTAKSPDGYEFTERFNIQTQFELKLDRQGKQKTAP